MNNNAAVELEGFLFECTSFLQEGNETSIVVRVSGNGLAGRDLTAWVLGLCPNAVDYRDVEIVSCEKRMHGGAWIPAAAQKTTYELSGDIGISGVMFDEPVGSDEEDPAIEFKIVLNGPVTPDACGVAYISGQTVIKSMDKMPVADGQEAHTDVVWKTPVERSFCLYIVVPEGYKPVGACKANLSITKRGVFLSHETGEYSADETGEDTGIMTQKTYLRGSVKIFVSLPLKSHQACGDTVQASACDCFDVDEVIGFTRNGKEFHMRDVVICPKKRSVDLTLLNAHCGKSVYRMDGVFIIRCKRCDQN